MTAIASHAGDHTLEFGLYRDGDNNLDAIQGETLTQAVAVSKRDANVGFVIEDTTAQRGAEPAHVLRTEDYEMSGGVKSDVRISSPHDMSSRANLAAFVAKTLDAAQTSHAKATWLDLVDHGGGDGGGLQADHGLGIMREDDIAGAIADGTAQHGKAHPEDAGRRVDGVVANQCLMATLGFSSALSNVGVRYLAASPETMLAPGVPTSVAEDIAQHLDDPATLAKAVVNDTMNTRYDAGEMGSFGPAAAFDMFDLDPQKIAQMKASVTKLDAALVGAGHDRSERSAIREDARAVDGMVRFEAEHMPWQADRPAMELYGTFAQDGRLDRGVRDAAKEAVRSIGSLVMAHSESSDVPAFNDIDYGDAVGPTVHFPVTKGQVDTWAPAVSETDNAFYKSVGEAAVARIYA